MTNHSDLWRLDPDVVFLNHGSFGATPGPVLDAQQRIRDRMEAEPVRFFIRELPDLLDLARRELAAFVGADPQGLAFVANATTGVNTVLASLELAAGDELLVTDHEYNACRNALDRTAAAWGATVVVSPIPFPIDGPDAVLEGLMERVTPRTRMALIDHVTSPTGMVLPVDRIVAELQGRGIDVLVDGAHAPGMLPLDLEALGAAWYTANCHKWLCAPKGAALLVVREDLRRGMRPLVTSHGANAILGDRSRFHAEFDWTGTDDPSPALCVPEAIRMMGSIYPGGWQELRSRNRDLALAGRRILCDALQVEAPCPDEMIGALAAVALPDGSPEPPQPPSYTDALQDALLERHGIEVPIIPWPAPPARLVRISAQAYNTQRDCHALARALVGLLSDSFQGAGDL